MDGVIIEDGMVVGLAYGVRVDATLQQGRTFHECGHAGVVVGERLPWPRVERNTRLSACDWTELPSRRAGMTEETATAWDAYRQALRDLPETCPDPLAVAWPDPPG